MAKPAMRNGNRVHSSRFQTETVHKYVRLLGETKATAVEPTKRTGWVSTVTLAPQCRAQSSPWRSLHFIKLTAGSLQNLINGMWRHEIFHLWSKAQRTWLWIDRAENLNRQLATTDVKENVRFGVWHMVTRTPLLRRVRVLECGDTAGP